MKVLEFLRQQTVWLLLLIIIILGSILSPDFLTTGNITNILRQAAALSFVSIGQTFAVIANVVDLSVGSTISLVQCVSANTMDGTVEGILPAILFTLGIVVLVGLFNGYFVAKRKGNPFIVTLGSMTVLQGVVLIYTNESPVGSVPTIFRFVADGNIGPIPFPILMVVAIFLIGQLVLRKTKFGRYTLAVGGNEEVARLSGVRVPFIKIMAYLLSGLGAAVTGLFLAARMNVGEPLVGSTFSLDLIAAVVIGGTNIAGGDGSLNGTLGGVLLYSVLSNMMNILNVSPFYQIALKGLIIVVAISIGQIRKLRK